MVANRTLGDRSRNETLRKQAIRNAAAEGITKQVTALTIFALNDIFVSIVAEATKGFAKEFELFAQSTNKTVQRNRETKIKKIHEEAAQDALRVVVRAFKSRPKPVSSSYRVGKGRESGKLLKAISSPEMYRVAQDGLDFINPAFLDREAKQWYRLNFGAGDRGAATPKAKSARITIFGQTTPADLALSGFTPSKDFLIPPGYWLPQGQTRWGKGQSHNDRSVRSRRQFKDEFYPIFSSRHKMYDTLGFAGSRFLDAGVSRLAKTIPFQYSKLMNEWLTEYGANKGPFTSQKVTLSPEVIDRAAALIAAKGNLYYNLRKLK